ncbi:MAG: hypothetical protein FJZ58_04875 [Chlamydiae bacterium]|nr:hypothetical protein [Chlamydiota bacterium]
MRKTKATPRYDLDIAREIYDQNTQAMVGGPIEPIPPKKLYALAKKYHLKIRWKEDKAKYEHVERNLGLFSIFTLTM